MNNYYFSKNEFIFYFEIILFSIIYYNIVIQVSEIIQGVAYNNYDDFQHANFIFSQNFISIFWELYNDKTDLRVR